MSRIAEQEFKLGATWIIEALLLGPEGTPLDVASAQEIEWRVGRYKEDQKIRPDMVLKKSTNKITVIDTGKIRITASGIDQGRLDAKTSYEHQVWVIMSGGDEFCPIEGRLRVTLPVGRE